MILETLLGSVGGGLLRLAPEVMKLLDAKNERSHELAMTNLSIEADKVKAANQIAVQESSAAGAFNVSALQALVEGIKGQAVPSGIKWVDALSSMVRPTLTFAFFGLYASARIAAFLVAVHNGTPALEVLKATWTGEDQVMLAGLMNFWFLGRVIDKAVR